MSGGSGGNVQVDAEPPLQTLFNKVVMTQIVNQFCDSDLVLASQRSFKKKHGNENRTLELLRRDDILKFEKTEHEALYAKKNISHLCEPPAISNVDLKERLGLSDPDEVAKQLRRTIDSQKATSPEAKNRDSGRLSTFDGLFVCSKDKGTEGTNRRIEAFVVCEIGQVDVLPQVWVLSLLCGGYKFGRVLVESVRYAVACQPKESKRNKFVILEVSNNYENYAALEVYYSTGFKDAFDLMSFDVKDKLFTFPILTGPWKKTTTKLYNQFMKLFNANVVKTYGEIKDADGKTKVVTDVADSTKAGCVGFPFALAMVAEISDVDSERKNIGTTRIGSTPEWQKYNNKLIQFKRLLQDKSWEACVAMLDESKDEYLLKAKQEFSKVAAAAGKTQRNTRVLPDPFVVPGAKPAAEPDAKPAAEPDAKLAANFSGGHNHKHDEISKSKLQRQRVARHISQQRRSQRRKSLSKQSQRTQSRNKQSRRKQIQRKISQKMHRPVQRKQSQKMQRPVQKKQSQKQQTQRKKSLKQRSAKHRKSHSTKNPSTQHAAN